MAADNRVYTDRVTERIPFSAFSVFCEVESFLAVLRLIRHTPFSVSILMGTDDFGDGAFPLGCKGFQATIFHEISEIAQLMEIACHAVVVAYPA